MCQVPEWTPELFLHLHGRSHLLLPAHQLTQLWRRLSALPVDLVNLPRHAHICWELCQCVIASLAELFYPGGRRERARGCKMSCSRRELLLVRLHTFIRDMEQVRDTHLYKAVKRKRSVITRLVSCVIQE